MWVIYDEFISFDKSELQRLIEACPMPPPLWLASSVKLCDES